jgi:hypothetical protein
MGRGC